MEGDVKVVNVRECSWGDPAGLTCNKQSFDTYW